MTRAWHVTIAAVALAAAAAGAQHPIPHLTGRAIDAQTGAPLAGVTVRLSGGREYTTTTDGEGRYRSGALLPGVYFVTATREGYVPATPQSPDGVPLRLRVRDGGPPVVQQDWMLEPAARIRGRLRDAYDNPLAGIAIVAAARAAGAEGWPRFDRQASAETGPDGTFEIRGLRRGPYVLAFEIPLAGSARWFFSPGIADPRHASTVEATLSNVNTSVELRAVPAPLARVSVRTMTTAGAPLADALVELRPWRPFVDAGEADPIAIVTDSGGRGTFANLPVGRHQIVARAPGALAARATARGEAWLTLPDQVIGGAAVRMAPTRSACLFTRIEMDGAARGDLESPPAIDISTRDLALTGERLSTRVTLGETARLEGVAPRSTLSLTAFAQQPLWSLSRFSPGQPAPRGVIPVDAAVAGCVAAYFRRTSEAIRGRVVLPDADWIPEIEVVAVPADSAASPVARAPMSPDGTFRIPGIAIGMRYHVSAIPLGFDIFSVASSDRQVVMATGGESIRVPLSVPITR